MREVFQRWGHQEPLSALGPLQCTLPSCSHPGLLTEDVVDPLDPGLCRELVMHPSVTAARVLLEVEDLIDTMPASNLAHYAFSLNKGPQRQHEVLLLSRRMTRDADELRALVAATALAILIENDPDSYDPALGRAALACRDATELLRLTRNWKRPLDHVLLPGALELATTLLRGTHWSWVLLDGDDPSSLLARTLYSSAHPDFACVPTAVVLTRVLACTQSSVPQDERDDSAVLETVRVLVDDGMTHHAAFAAARALAR